MLLWEREHFLWVRLENLEGCTVLEEKLYANSFTHTRDVKRSPFAEK